MQGRLTRVEVSFELFCEIMTEGWSVGGETSLTCIKGLPPGARPVGLHIKDPGIFVITFEHESFAVVPPDQDPPYQEIIYRFERPFFQQRERETHDDQ